jgi:hypothetical protein
MTHSESAAEMCESHEQTSEHGTSPYVAQLPAQTKADFLPRPKPPAQALDELIDDATENLAVFKVQADPDQTIDPQPIRPSSFPKFSPPTSRAPTPDLEGKFPNSALPQL